MTKLTEAQRRVLEAMRDGWVMLVAMTPNLEVRLSHEGKRQYGDERTYQALKKRGYIAAFREPIYWTYTYHWLTDAGRAALQQSGVVGEGEG